MNSDRLINYYQILDCDITDSITAIFNKFKGLVLASHPEFSKNTKNEIFLLQNEAYYILFYEPDRNIYNKLYSKKYLHETNVDLTDSELKALNISIETAQIKANEYLNLSFKEYWRDIPKRESAINNILRHFGNIIIKVISK